MQNILITSCKAIEIKGELPHDGDIEKTSKMSQNFEAFETFYEQIDDQNKTEDFFSTMKCFKRTLRGF